jgi:hypothetical protein
MNRMLAFSIIVGSLSYADDVIPLPAEGDGLLNFREVRAAGAWRTGKTAPRDLTVFTGDSVVPQFVDGDSWATTVILVNLDKKRIHVQLLFFDDNGRDLPVSIIGRGTVRGIDVTLEPLSSQTIQTTGTSRTLSQGWAYIIRDDIKDRIGGMAVFRQRVTGPDFEGVVPIVSEFDKHFVMPFDNTNGFTTGYAIANSDVDPITVTATVRSETGAVLERKTITLGRLAHLAATVPSAFPSTAGRKGIIEFESTGYGASALGLRFNPTGPFTSFHVLTNIDWELGN